LKTRKTIQLPPFFIWTLILTLIVYAQPPNLNVTVETDRPYYYFGQPITIYGNLTSNGTPITEGLIGLEIDYPEGVLILRTLNTGTPPPQQPIIEILNAYPSDRTGAPQNTFPQKSLAYFTITLRNNDLIEAHQVLVAITIFDSAKVPLSTTALNLLILENKTLTVILSAPIPQKAYIGNATAHITALKDWPRNGGTPYTNERLTTFNITGTGSIGTPPPEPNINGNYNLTFKISEFEAYRGSHTIYVTAEYMGEYAQNTKTFQVKIPGDINDDGKVDGKDASILAYSWGSKTGDPNYNPKADLNQDGKIDGKDASTMAKYWGYRA
jgi:hypothetical protein